MNEETLDGGSIRRTDDPGEPQTGQPRISITKDEARILCTMAVDKFVLEIGTGLGVSTHALAASAKSVVTLDIDPWVHENVWPTLPKNVYCIKSIEDIRWDDFNMVFIDGDHNTEAARRDILLADLVLKPGGKVVLHDTKYPNVRAACDGPEWSHIDTHHGLSWKTV